MDSDAQLQLEVEVAAEYRIPHSTLLAWDKGDRDLAIWHHVRKAQKCGGCGTRREEWSEAAGGRRDAYAGALDICPGCEARQNYEATLDKDSLPRGAQVVLRRRG